MFGKHDFNSVYHLIKQLAKHNWLFVDITWAHKYLFLPLLAINQLKLL